VSLDNHSTKRKPDIILQTRVRNRIPTCSIDIRACLCLIGWHGEHKKRSVKTGGDEWERHCEGRSRRIIHRIH
jgi:hypothetical protein